MNDPPLVLGGWGFEKGLFDASWQGCQLTTQPPDLLLGQTGLGHWPSVMISFTSVMPCGQHDSD